MDGLDIAAFVVMAIIAGMLISAFVFLGSWPGRIARRLNHPYSSAISIGGWVTLIFGGVGWPFILIWAYAPPGGDAAGIPIEPADPRSAGDEEA